MESSIVSAMKGDKLKDSTQWRNWLARVKLFARQKKVWDLVNPQIEEDELEQPMREPRMPQYPEGGSETAKREWRDRLDIYKIELAKWEQQAKALDAVNEWIITNLDPIHHTSLLDYETPYERLAYLEARFARSNAHREEIRAQWKRFGSISPRKGVDIDRWLDDWNTLREHAATLDLHEAKSANEDFLRAVKDVLPMWWQAKYESIIMNGDDWETRDLIENFRGFYHEMVPRKQVSTISKASFSTFQDFEEAEVVDDDQQKPSQQKAKLEDKPFAKRWCPCGNRSHKPWLCFVINEAVRPQGWTVQKAKKQRVEKALKQDPQWKDWIESKVQEHNERQKEKLDESANSAFPSQISFFTSTDIAALNSAPALQDLRSRWVLDNASSMHVCNDRSRFLTFTPTEASLKTGDSTTPVEGHGTVELCGVDPSTGQEKTITLSNALYSPGFHTNLVSYGALKKKGGRWDEDRDCIRDPKGTPVVSLKPLDSLNLWVFDSPRVDVGHAHAVRRSEKPLVSEATAEIWHRRLGHIAPQTVQKAADMVDGIKIKGDVQEESKSESTESRICEVCKLSHAPRQISRRPIGQTFGRYGRIHFDLVHFSPGYNSHQWMTHFYIEGIRFHWLYTHAFKSECREAVRKFIALVKNWWNLPIRAFHYDNETAAGAEVEAFLANCGIVISHSIPGHPEQNGPAERSGGVIVEMARRLRIEGGLPKQLWPEFVSAAAWILNRTPTYLEDRWIVPWEEARKEFAGDRMKRSSLANLRLYGSLSYCRIRSIPRKEKTHPRAEIGFLVGYVASNVWKIWFPARQKVEFVRDAFFDESRKWKPDMQYWQDIKLPQPEPEVLTYQEYTRVIQEDLSISDSMLPPQDGQNRNVVESQQESQQEGEAVQEVQVVKENEIFTHDLHHHQPLPTPERESETHQDTPFTEESHNTQHTEEPSTPPSEGIQEEEPEDSSPAAAQGVVEEVQNQQDQQEQTPALQDQPEEPVLQEEEKGLSDSEQQLQQELLGPRRSGRRRKAREDHEYVAHATTEDPPELLKAFAAALYTEKPIRRHRDDLPPPPENWKEMLRHPYAEGFMEACGKEIRTLTDKSTFTIVDKPRDISKQVLPLRWVFAYKFDQDGYLVKLKARICVRGDLETISPEEKRAATLAARTARMIFALVAAFNLDLRQRDAVSAFLNSKLPKEIYTWMPDGFALLRKCWRLNRALYGLRISPKLWQQEATRVLEKLGLQRVPEDPCVFVKRGIIVFFYVDDILIASHPSVGEEARQLERDLQAHWELTDHGEAEWFLNIRILRDRQQHKLWLCQDTYLSSIAMRFHLTERAPVLTPLPVEDLKPYEGTASAEEIKLYQQKVGSAQYATVITRPDAAKATAKLAQFLTNPGPQHQHAIDRVICYLYTTRFRAIEYGKGSGIESIEFASDASYGDNIDRRSSAGYMCQVYGGPVDWKASKQPTVTTSTTEAELLGLSDAARSLQWWKRFIARIQFTPDHPISIRCDNQQTVDLLTSEQAKIDTKLRHVDIHGHWLRQEVREGRIKVIWVPTGQMVADGLTKLLPRQKHEHFIKMLRMTDISQLID
jgi:Reverse transcriptase (RNA-dependent DNA polymerase)